MATFLILAGVLNHIPLILPLGPYWSGWFSEGLIFGMILSGIGVAVTGLSARIKEETKILLHKQRYGYEK